MLCEVVFKLQGRSNYKVVVEEKSAKLAVLQASFQIQ